MYNFNPLKEILKEKGMTQIDIVRGADVAPRTVRRMLDGENVSLDTVQRIADFLGVDICEIIGRE